MEGVARRINACDDSCFDRFARERGVPPAGHVVIVPCGISQSEKRDLGSRNAMHHAAPTVFAVTHRTPHAFHAVAVFDQPTRIRRPMQKDSPPIVVMRRRNRPNGPRNAQPRDCGGDPKDESLFLHESNYESAMPPIVKVGISGISEAFGCPTQDG